MHDKKFFSYKNGATEFRPFLGKNYGYGMNYMTISSYLIWGLQTYGNFTLGWAEFLVPLIFAFVVEENKSIKKLILPYADWGNGASYVHNVQAGVNMFHYYLKSERTWPLILGVLSETTGDLGAIVEELVRDQDMYSHYAHWNGLAHGVFLAFLMDLLSKKKYKLHPFWLALPVTLGAMVIKDQLDK